MVKIADSAAIRPYIPTCARGGSFHSSFSAGSVKDLEFSVVLISRGPLYSYFQSGSSGCLRSHRGRRLWTVGRTAKLYAGGGDWVDHLRVQASQGSFAA